MLQAAWMYVQGRWCLSASRTFVKCCGHSTGGGCLPGLLQGLLGSCSPGDQDLQAQHCQLPEMDLILDLTAEIQSILNKLPSTNAISEFSPKVSEQRPADTLFSAVFHF